jgi:hypothetical protein
MLQVLVATEQNRSLAAVFFLLLLFSALFSIQTVKAQYHAEDVRGNLITDINPDGAATNVNQPVNFTVQVSGDHPPFTYQWYVGKVVSWTTLSINPLMPIPSRAIPWALGSASSTFVFNPNSTGTYEIGVIINDSSGYSVNVSGSFLFGLPVTVSATPAATQYPTIMPTQTTSPTQTPTAIPSLQPKESPSFPPAQRQTRFLGTSLPMEYGYAVLIALIISAISGLSAFYFKKLRQKVDSQ